MSWNNRIMKRWTSFEGWYHSIHEVYYNEYGTPIMWTVEAVDAGGCGMTELIEDYKQLKEAFNAPVLDYETGVDKTFYYMWR